MRWKSPQNINQTQHLKRWKCKGSADMTHSLTKLRSNTSLHNWKWKWIHIQKEIISTIIRNGIDGYNWWVQLITKMKRKGKHQRLVNSITYSHSTYRISHVIRLLFIMLLLMSFISFMTCSILSFRICVVSHRLLNPLLSCLHCAWTSPSVPAPTRSEGAFTHSLASASAF